MPDFLFLDELKRRLHVSHDGDDLELQGYLDAAQSFLGDPENGILRRPVVAQEFTEVFDDFESIWLAFPDDAREVTIAYISPEGVPGKVGSIYTVSNGRVDLIDGQSWPRRRGPVSVAYTAGWAEGEVPAGIKEAGYFIARSYYEQGDKIDMDRFRAVVAFQVSAYRRVTL